MSNEKQESGELIFLRYGFPVINYCSRLIIESEELADFVNILKTGQGEIKKERLEQLFPNAVNRIASWSPEHVRDYWLEQNGHNLTVGMNHACKTYKGKVLGIYSPAEDEICQAKIIGLEKIPLKSYIDLKQGDWISLHAFQVSEKLTPRIIAKYFEK